MVDIHIKNLLNRYLNEFEEFLEGDIISFYGPIIPSIEESFKKIVEGIDNKKNKVFIILTTTGGSAETTERLVNILRYFYSEVNFIIPNYAYSAGTIFCMSGDNIFMNYYSVLGPIDPQVLNKDGKYVPALGYIYKLGELLRKAEQNKISQAEFLILKDFDLAELRTYEQAKELTVSLLKKWLVKYKFKNWTTTESGVRVTEDMKIERASEIAEHLGDYDKWKSHGRPIDINTLTLEINIKINDYSQNEDFNKKLNNYYSLLVDYIKKFNYENFFHTRRFI